MMKHVIRHDGIRHLALKTRDLRATRRFYLGVLGFEVAFRHRGMLFLRTPGGSDLLNFIKSEKAVRSGGLDHFGLHVPRAAWKGVLERLDAAGVPIEGRRGRSAVYIRDPNGYTVELYAD